MLATSAALRSSATIRNIMADQGPVLKRFRASGVGVGTIAGSEFVVALVLSTVSVIALVISATSCRVGKSKRWASLRRIRGA